MFKYVEKDGEVFATEDPISKQKRIKEKYEYFLKRSGIPSFYWNIEFSDYKGSKDSEQFKKIKYYADNCDSEKFNHVNLYVYGKNSTQKTALCCNVLKTALRKGLDARFILAGTLIDSLMKLQGFNKDEDLYNYIKDLKKCDILLIDDIADSAKSLTWKNPESNQMLISEWDQFLRTILSNKTKVILTSNFDKHMVEQQYGKSVYELIDRNFVCLELKESIKEYRKLNVESAFEDMNTNLIPRRRKQEEK